jgi:NAD(P)-dependent dehydrogenase (short-subunit alcohol dehydrogenase family)
VAASVLRCERQIDQRGHRSIGAQHGVHPLEQNWGRGEMLVNYAGVGARGPVLDGDPARFRSLIDVNFTALTELTTLLLAAMVARGHGAVVNIASTGGTYRTLFDGVRGEAWLVGFQKSVPALTSSTRPVRTR